VERRAARELGAPMASLLERYADRISGVLACFDRVVVMGTLPVVAWSEGMESLLRSRGVRVFDYPRFCEPLRDEIREAAERTARENGIEVEFISKASFRKESRVQEILAKRGDHPGLVAILSAMEGCTSYKPRYDKAHQRAYLQPTTAKCLHYYFYFQDETLGLIYVRVPTWCPFRLQVYFNGHAWLAGRLKAAGIAFRMQDNAFVEVADFAPAQKLADEFPVEQLHQILDRYAHRCCPVIAGLGQEYHWSLMQVEYATDVIFRTADALKALYEGLTYTAIHAVKPEHVATFFGRKPVVETTAETTSRLKTTVQGTCIKHQLGPATIKMYDKHGFVLRIETTTNDVSFFKCHRMVEHPDREATCQVANVKKTIYSLPIVRELFFSSNRRYLAFLSALDDDTEGRENLNRLTRPREENGRRYPGFNFFATEDAQLLAAIARGEHAISGLRHKDLRPHLPERSRASISRAIKRLRTHGLIRKIGHTYKYYVTELGLRAIAAGQRLRELLVIPTLAQPAGA